MKIDFEAICIILSLGLFFGLVNLIKEFSFSNFLIFSGIGAFIGFAGLPYFDKKKWTPQPFVCAVIASGVLISHSLSREEVGTTVALYGAGGFLIGYLSPYFVKYI